MEMRHGAGVCALVGIFLLDKLSSVYFFKCIGIYPDNGLAAFKNLCGQDWKQLRK